MSPARIGHRWWRLAFALAVLLNVAILYLPVAVRPPSSLPFLDKVVHATSFGLIAVTGCMARVPLKVLVVLIVGEAVVSEVVQGTVTVLHRDGDWADAVADLVGGALGFGGFLLWRSRRRRRSQLE
jgi:VanZ family protein